MPLPARLASLLRHCAVRCDHAGDCGAGAAQPTWHRGQHRWALYGLLAGRVAFGGPLQPPEPVAAPASILVPPGQPLLERPLARQGVRLVMAWGQLLPAAGWTIGPLLAALPLVPVVIADRTGWARDWDALLPCFARWQPRDDAALCRAGFRLGELLLRHLEEGGVAVPMRPPPPPWLRDLVERPVLSQARHRWRVDAAARLAGVSAVHLRRLCLRHYGATPHALLRGARVRYALQHLSADPRGGVAAAARHAGYEDPELFTRHCRAVTGRSPTALRGR